jgi:hypothetical protein
MGTEFWRGGKYENPKKEEVQKREAYKKAPLKKNNRDVSSQVKWQ